MNRKPRILITYDAPNWAYHKNAKILQKYLSDEFDICLLYDQDKISLLRHISQSEYDLVFFQWYKDIDIMMLSGLLHRQPCISQIATTYIFDRDIKSTGWSGYKFWPLMIAKNKELYDMLSLQRKGLGVELAYHVNDHEIFFKHNKPKVKNKDFTVAFVGHTDNPRKGYSLIKEACKASNVNLKTIDFSNKIPYEDLPDFYRSVDATICASDMEGAPNPVIESGLVGTPIITTRVGQIGEMVVNEENAIVVNRDTQSLALGIQKLQNDDSLYENISVNIYKTCYDWNMKAFGQWRKIFKKSIK